jgi:hypothetical protein
MLPCAGLRQHHDAIFRTTFPIGQTLARANDMVSGLDLDARAGRAAIDAKSDPSTDFG